MCSSISQHQVCVCVCVRISVSEHAHILVRPHTREQRMCVTQSQQPLRSYELTTSQQAIQRHNSVLSSYRHARTLN